MDISRQAQIEAFIRENLRYEPETGELWWTKETKGRGRPRGIDRPIGTRDDRGYYKLLVTINGKRYVLKAHRVAYFLMTGEWPEQVDHINQDKGDNRWANLRAVTASQNRRNRTEWKSCKGLPRGVRQGRRSTRYEAVVTLDYTKVYLGCYDTPSEAHAAYLGACYALGLREYLPS